MKKTRFGIPLGMVAGALLLVLAAMGVVQGLWSKNLVVHGTVATGDLNADWTFRSCREFNPWPTGGSDGEWLGKNVGSFTAVIDPRDAQILNVTADNAYPSYAVDCEVEWTNTGTIPVNFSGFAIVPGPELHNCTITGTTSKTMICDEQSVVFVDGIGAQVDPGDFAAHSLRFHTEQKAAQGDCTGTGWGTPSWTTSCTRTVTYTWQVKLCVAQWNEAATYDQCVTSPQHEGPR